MPFVPGTPESRLQRSDSKNPATTCKGITAEGKHCRRDITSHLASTFGISQNGVIAVLPAGDEDHDGAAAYFCWQHKDQAASLATVNAEGRKGKIIPVHRRSSVDTLAERLGIVEVDDEDGQNKPRRKRRHHNNPRPARKETLPQQWQDVDGPLLAVGPHQKPKPKKKKSSFCCFQIEYDDSSQSSRPAQMSERPPRLSAARPSAPMPNSQTPSTPVNKSFPNSPQASPLPKPHPAFSRPPQRRHSSQTQSLLTWMPSSLSPTTTSTLLAELAKPPSAQDEEGYIYMFWLTDSSDTSNARSPSNVLDPSNLIHDGEGVARGSTPISPRSPGKEKRKVKLKIGRAANVQRRMQQWTRQCGYELSVVRFYPYNGTSTTSSGSNKKSSLPPPTKVPLSHKVERLIQLELADARIMTDCAACGKQHREWFEVEASTKAMGVVDEVCRRWCAWAQQRGKGS